MIGEMWWQSISNAVRFLREVQYILESDKSVILNFPDSVPWLDIMTDEIGQRIMKNSDTRSFEVHDVSDVTNPGEFLYNNFYDSSEEKYWPTKHISYERFMSANEKATLNNRVICAVGINSTVAPVWLKSVKEYHETCTLEKHGLFVLITQGANVRSSEFVECLRFSDYITDYDCMMLCLVILSSVECERTQKLYIAEVASNIADNRIEIAGLLAEAGIDLVKNPLRTVKEIFDMNNIKCTNIDDKVNTGVWEAQIRFAFPRIENFRSRIVERYKSRIEKYLPIKNAFNEQIEKVNDIEVGQLCALCSKYKIPEQSEIDMLKKMRDARNSLAHRNALTYEQLMSLMIF